ARRRIPKPGAASPAASVLPQGEDDSLLRTCLEGIRKREEAALARLYDLTVSRVYGVALRILRSADLAEEAVSDVYMQVWRDVARYDDSRGRVLAWLLIIARSRSLDLLRRQDEAFSHPDPYDLASEPEAGRGDPHDLLAATRDAATLHAALLSIHPLQRQLLSLAFFKGLSHSEIVDHTGIPLGSVKTHIRRALAVLRASMGADIQTDFEES
ncbi:RNA polymerase sigma factor, partial [Casimicrobium huifangae]|uniref:RNA polymerase sigma factor n=1 Tax=Casimicrobium huifangae TaxID=2591109 RepID=UPI0037847253